LKADGEGYVLITYSLVSLTTINGAAIPPGSIAATFSDDAVPEPASMALLGIGMSNFFAFRRFLKRTART